MNICNSDSNWFVNWADYPQMATDGAGNRIAHFLEKSEKGSGTSTLFILKTTLPDIQGTMGLVFSIL